jgi:glycoside/pentoside/hexuronide:cation symporter, GPH family
MHTTLPPASASPHRREASLSQIVTYSLGEGANSLVINGVFGFALLYFTKALGLSPMLAGLAMSISVFWEAISEPVMGHISDNTRSRWGQRLPYMVLGGLSMALCTYFIWQVPSVFRSNPTTIFWYLVVMNLFLRTALTMFFIPYVALGFEICTDYQDRSKVQGARQAVGMAANFFGPAMAWTFFFQDRKGVKGTDIPENYLHMGTAFAIATAIFVVVVVVTTFGWHQDTRKIIQESNQGQLKSFFIDFKQILLDINSRWVFLFVFVVCVGMVLVSSLQIFLYVDFMNFGSMEKTIAHGSTMVACGLGGLLSIPLTRLLDKKKSVLLAGVASISANFILALCFLTNWIPVNLVWHVGGFSIPVALGVFVFFHAVYWLGNGIMIPVSSAMIADVSEIHQMESGINKDGGYAAVYSLAMRMAISFSIATSGLLLGWIGYKTSLGAGEAVVQSADAVWRLGAVALIVGPLISLASLLIIARYRIDRKRFEEIRESFSKRVREA